MKQLLITLVVLVAVLGISLVALNSFIYNEKQEQPPQTFEPYRATLKGKGVCLPHKDTSGPQTDECAFGMRTEAGEYYALDFNLMSQGYPDELYNGTIFSANGTVTPIENLSASNWQKYNVKGIFSVTDSVQIDYEASGLTPPTNDQFPPAEPEPTPVQPAPPASAGGCYVGGCSSQLCTDQPDVASTCEWREAYACYQGQTCERQATGQCGWTPTPQLQACLANAN